MSTTQKENAKAAASGMASVDAAEMRAKEREKVELEDAMTREVYDPEEKVFNMQKQRVTDLKHNAYVILPPAQEIDYESLLELRRQKQSQIFKDYVRDNCDEKGRQRSNITKQQARGLKKLRKRIGGKERERDRVCVCGERE